MITGLKARSFWVGGAVEPPGDPLRLGNSEGRSELRAARRGTESPASTKRLAEKVVELIQTQVQFGTFPPPLPSRLPRGEWGW